MNKNYLYIILLFWCGLLSANANNSPFEGGKGDVLCLGSYFLKTDEGLHVEILGSTFNIIGHTGTSITLELTGSNIPRPAGTPFTSTALSAGKGGINNEEILKMEKQLIQGGPERA